MMAFYPPVPPVALRKESVDRNSIVLASFRAFITSLSARRAWIEIFLQQNDENKGMVALRKESVDRNSKINTRGSEKVGRSPQGERG